MPRTTRTRSVEPPLQATSRQRTPRTSLASESEAPSSAASSAICQPVADAADGLDPAAGIAELRAQVVHVRIDGIRRDRDRERPGLVEELVPGERLTRVAKE